MTATFTCLIAYQNPRPFIIFGWPVSKVVSKSSLLNFGLIPGELQAKHWIMLTLADGYYDCLTLSDIYMADYVAIKPLTSLGTLE